MHSRFISLYFASIGLREAFLVLGALLSWPFIPAQNHRAKLEEAVRQYFNDAKCFSYTSGRGSLAACLAAAGIGRDDEVLLSSFTCLAVPTAVLAVGARPTYCDIDPRTLNVTPESVVASLTPTTRAVVVQHTLGSAADVLEIIRRVHLRGILVIEDCALAIGSTREGRAVGSFGDAAIFSMELSKTISSGWGGVLVVNDDQLASRVSEHYVSFNQPSFTRMGRMAIQTAVCGVCYNPRLYSLGRYAIAIAFKLRLFGRTTPPEELNGHVAPGGPQASLGTHQWKRLGIIAQHCVENADRIRRVLQKLGYVPLGTFGPNFFSITPRVSFLVADRPSIMKWFHKRGVELGSWFDGPLSPSPDAIAFNFSRDAYPKACFIAEHIVNIPCHSRVTESDLEHIEHVLREYAAAHPEDLGVQKQLQEL